MKNVIRLTQSDLSKIVFEVLKKKYSLNETISTKKKLINEMNVDDYLKPSQNTNSERYLYFLKKVGIPDFKTYKQKCIKNYNCRFTTPQIKRLEPLLNDTWDNLSDWCWKCFGSDLTKTVVQNELMTNALNKYRNLCDVDENEFCEIKLSGATFELDYSMGDEGMIRPRLFGVISGSFYDNYDKSLTNNIKLNTQPNEMGYVNIDLSGSINSFFDNVSKLKDS